MALVRDQMRLNPAIERGLDVGPGHQTSQQLIEATADPIPWHLALEGVGVRKKESGEKRQKAVE